MKAMHPYLCRWWCKVRPTTTGEQINKDIPHCLEFYVPVWAWPLEIIHRLIFGSTKFKTDK